MVKTPGGFARRARRAIAELVRRACYRMRFGKFAHLGRGVRISRSAQIENARNVRIGDNSDICEYALLRVSATGTVTMGAGCYIGRYTEVIDGGGCVELGDRVQLGGSNFVSGQGGLRIGDNVIVAPMASIVANEHTFADREKPIRDQPCVAEGITIGSNGWIGVGATITDGVNVGEHVVVGASAVVTKDVPSYSVVVGVPARVIREIR